MFKPVLCLFLSCCLLVNAVGCPEIGSRTAGLTEANLERVKVGMSIEKVAKLLGQKIDPKTRSIELKIKLKKPVPTKNGGTRDFVPVLIEFKNGKVTKIHRAMVD